MADSNGLADRELFYTFPCSPTDLYCNDEFASLGALTKMASGQGWMGTTLSPDLVPLNNPAMNGHGGKG